MKGNKNILWMYVPGKLRKNSYLKKEIRKSLQKMVERGARERKKEKKKIANKYIMQIKSDLSS